MQNFRIFHPTVYVGLGMATVSTAFFMWDYRHGNQVTRYKHQYTIYRPDEGLARCYPRYYITDNHLLPDNHPKTLEECDDVPKGKPILENNLYRRLSYPFK